MAAGRGHPWQHIARAGGVVLLAFGALLLVG